MPPPGQALVAFVTQTLQGREEATSPTAANAGRLSQVQAVCGEDCLEGSHPSLDPVDPEDPAITAEVTEAVRAVREPPLQALQRAGRRVHQGSPGLCGHAAVPGDLGSPRVKREKSQAGAGRDPARLPTDLGRVSAPHLPARTATAGGRTGVRGKDRIACFQPLPGDPRPQGADDISGRTDARPPGLRVAKPKHQVRRTNRDIVSCKSGVCHSMRAKFYSVAQEAGFCLQDKMEIFMKRQEERGLQKFHSFVLVSNIQKDLAKMRHQVSVGKGDAEEMADHWYFDLLSKLPEDLKNFRPTKKILAKLQKFGENLDLRIRPHVLLKVLHDLRTWELCSPDIAVAIEFVREHIIHMPQEDYINWLQNRINIPIWPSSALT
ncbi:PREDICTED: coiled-coil domain-containing protein 60 [Galeopterus variegatus]|uniref:Coiled-coil domain-containing protein 60 n=1 Tax=Galeopterus variegatus TaxID=482537 RepID=A0ABM0R3A9_GALVR|nr:PREDICTED: coiled-coil domain-containing protein 60 [Galeopterus variegatus]